ncbi:MAG: 50S ribosomal protein L17 [Candidatus Omnitrophota bacterium]
MRHKKTRLQFNRFTSWRKLTLRSLVRAILLNQSIKTTQTKAKAVKPLVDKLITLGKENSLFARRQAYKILCDHKLVTLLFNDISPRFTERKGGYTRLINFGNRRGDNARLAVIELSEIKKKEPRAPKKAKAKEGSEGPSEAIRTSGVIAPEKPQEGKSVPGKAVKTPETETKDRPPISRKPHKKFLGGLRGIFKKERDSL